MTEKRTRLHITLSDGRAAVASGRVIPGRAANFNASPPEPPEPVEVEELAITYPQGAGVLIEDVPYGDEAWILDALIEQAQQDAEDDWYGQGERQRIDAMLNNGAQEPDDV